MKKDLLELLNQTKDWGMSLISASSTPPRGRALAVYHKTTVDVFLVGRLSCEQEEYVFRYDSSYVGEPISAFPMIDQEYRSRLLWPFFATRIPPFNREDVRKEIRNRSLREDQVLEVLGSVAKVSVANPYEFELI